MIGRSGVMAMVFSELGAHLGISEIEELCMCR